MDPMKELVRSAAARFDVHLARASNQTPSVRTRFLQRAGVTTVLDVGAHVGEWAREVRKNGFSGRIESFEPNPQAYGELARRARRDANWMTHQLALGTTTGSTEFHVAENEVSSSVLPMTATHEKAAPGSAFTHSISVRLARLDETLHTHPSDRLCLKMDTQGFEGAVLSGAQGVMDQIHLIELELSIKELYEGQSLYLEVLQGLKARGFDLIWLDRGFEHRATKELLQFNAILQRTMTSVSG